MRQHVPATPEGPVTGPERPRLARRRPGTHLHSALRARADEPRGPGDQPDPLLLDRIADGLRRLDDGNSP